MVADLEDKKKRLETQIEGCNRVIKYNNNDHKTFFIKGTILVKLAEYTNDKEYYQQAMECYDKAINFSSENPLYLTERAKLYIEINQINLAIKDIQKIKELPKSFEDMEFMYIRDIIEEIETKLGSPILSIKIEYYSEPLLQVNQSSSNLVDNQAASINLSGAEALNEI